MTQMYTYILTYVISFSCKFRERDDTLVNYTVLASMEKWKNTITTFFLSLIRICELSCSFKPGRSWNIFI